MDKLKKVLKKLCAPAIVLLLVAAMGVFSPLVQVATALPRLSVAAAGVGTALDRTIQNLPARVVELGSTSATVNPLPSVTDGSVELWHAGRKVTVAGSYTYPEVGQYEWRFYTTNTTDKVLFDTYTVTVKDTTYTMTVSDKVVTVAPKDLNELKLPLPSNYTVGGDTMEVVKDNIVGTHDDVHYAVIPLKDKKGNTKNYHLSVQVSLENDTFAENLISIDDKNVTINLTDKGTGNLKVTYLLKNESDKLLVAVPLKTVVIKNVRKGDVTFSNVPTAPSVSNLSYYSSVNLSAPSADNAKVDEKTSFAVEAQTSIVKVQAYLYSTEPNSWKNNSNVHTLTVDENGVVKENGSVSDILEIDGLNVKIKKLGYYRFQFQTSTLFGYKLEKDPDSDAIEQDANKTYVRYWSDSVRIYNDTEQPNFAWVKDYTINKDGENKVIGYTGANGRDYDEDFADLLKDYDKSLPSTEKMDASTAKKITVNYTQGLTLPAIFPHDNATSFANMKVTTFSIEQIQDAAGKPVSDNYVSKSSTTEDEHHFIYDMSKHVRIKFAPNGDVSNGNEVTLKESAGLYRVRVVVEDEQPKFEGDGKTGSGNWAQQRTKDYYFYVDSDAAFDCGVAGHDHNSPVIDENNAFQISDVYLWEGRTFSFEAPTFSDAHTPTNSIKFEYYLVRKLSTATELIGTLDYVAGADRVNVDFDKIKYESTLNFETAIGNHLSDGSKFYVYAVARNFNGMQANLKEEYAQTGSNDDGSYFETGLFGQISDAAIAQYGYAWKSAEFAIHNVAADKTASIATPSINVDGQTAADKFIANKTVTIENPSMTWDNNAVVDGQTSVAVYQVKDGKLTAVNVYNGNTASKEIISSIAFKGKTKAFGDLYFTPKESGNYILVLTAKDNASNKTFTKIVPIEIGESEELTPRVRTSTASQNSLTIDSEINLGESFTIPEPYLERKNSGKKAYVGMNRDLYECDANGVVTSTKIGYYTITLLGVNDSNCITGNKCVPNNSGCKYTFRYDYYRDNGSRLIPEEEFNTYVVRVNEASNSASIRMGEDYDTAGANHILWANDNHNTDNGKTQMTIGSGNTNTYYLGYDNTNTKDKPAYAITLEQFTMTNYGAENSFVLDSADLFQYLEPEFKDNEIKGYMYPAIAIPMPNVVADTMSSDEVEITVQKSGKTEYLVSTKSENAGNSINKKSIIEKIGGYYVFRPEGTFSKTCKTNYNENNYLQSADSKSGASGVYVVTYKTNTTSVSFNITIGNTKSGEIDWENNFLTYNNGDSDKAITDATDDLVIEKDNDGHRYVTIDMSKVFFTGNEDMLDLIAQGPNGNQSTDGYASTNDHAREYYWKNVNVTVNYESGSYIDNGDWSDAATETKAIKNHGEFKYKFDLTGSGTYEVTIKMYNSYTASYVSKSIKFTIDTQSTNKNVNLNTVWGVILIILSLGLAGGVVFYFVRTARATRFVDAPRALKNKDKKETAKPVAAPKDVEAPKDDAK